MAANDGYQSDAYAGFWQTADADLDTVAAKAALDGKDARAGVAVVGRGDAYALFSACCDG